MSEQRDELAAAFLRTEALASKKIDRRNWTTDQWVDDVERIMGHIDGASSALLNGHVTALLRTIRGLREATKPRTITTVEELDALPVGSVIRTAQGAISELQIYKEQPQWVRPGDGEWIYASCNITLPATVLYEPTP